VINGFPVLSNHLSPSGLFFFGTSPLVSNGGLGLS
jgi:hypothetical protein